MKMGGVGKNAIYFMKQILPYCDVTLILNENSGELLSEVPKEVNVVIDRMRTFKEVLRDDLRHLRIGKLIKDVGYYLNIKRGKDTLDNYRYLALRTEPVCAEQFDCAISYHGQSPELLINLLDRTRAETKCVWIHGRMSFPEERCSQMQKYYDRIDRLFFVSEVTRSQFGERISIDGNRTMVYYNPMDKDEILEKAEEKAAVAFSKDHINLLTVGRLSGEKGQHMIPEITRMLIDKGWNIRWYLVGEGDSEPLIRKQIKEYGVQDSVILMGVVVNPYPYVKACTLYVQPSYSEGYSTTICEAGLLGKAIVATRTSGGIGKQIQNNVNGVLVDPKAESICEGIIKVLEDKTFKGRLEENILERHFEEDSDVREFLRVLEQDKSQGQ